MALDYQQAWVVLETGALSDFTIVCSKHSFKVHKLALYPKSSFFRSCIEGGFKESQEGILILRDYHPRTVAYMILFTYLGKDARYLDIDDMWPGLKLSQSEKVDGPLGGAEDLHYVALYELGIFLMYDELKTFAQKELLYNLNFYWETLEAVVRSRPKIPQIYLDKVT